MKQNPNDAIAARLRVARAARGMQARDLARRIGISTPRMSRLERAHQLPRDEEIDKIADVLGVSPTWLTDPSPLPLGRRRADN